MQKKWIPFVIAGAGLATFVTLEASAQKGGQSPSLSQGVRSEITAQGPCSLVLQDHLVQLILGPDPDKKQTADEEIVVRQPAEGSPCQDLVQRLGKLSEPELTDLARTLSKEADPLVGSLGANLLFKLGAEDEAIGALAGIVAGGQGQRIYLAPSNKYDMTLADRLMARISRYLLAHFESYQGAARTHVEQYLSMWSTTIPFSRSEAERRLAEFEAEIKKRSSP